MRARIAAVSPGKYVVVVYLTLIWRYGYMAYGNGEHIRAQVISLLATLCSELFVTLQPRLPLLELDM